MSLTRFTSLIIMIFGMVMFMLTPLEGELKKSIKKILLAVLGGIIVLILILGAGLQYVPKVKTAVQNISDDYNYDAEKDLLTYTDESGNQYQIPISEIKNDAENGTYIEKNRKDFLFIYKYENVLHISKD